MFAQVGLLQGLGPLGLSISVTAPLPAGTAADAADAARERLVLAAVEAAQR